MAEGEFDLIVIGAGPGGYVCAIKAAQLGLKTACIEKRATLGGVCLNVGCIPSKALLSSTHLYEMAQHRFAKHGIKVAGAEVDLKAMMASKEKIVTDLTKGIEFLFKKNKVAHIKGSARLLGQGKVEVKDAAGKLETLTASNIVIATGSDVTPLANVAIDEKTILSSTGALALEKVPQHLIVIGGGVIGLEMGSVWRRLGANVTVVEYADRLAPAMDGETMTLLQRTLTKQGFAFKLGTKVTGASKAAKSGEVTLSLEPSAGGNPESLTGDAVLVAVGRRPYTEGLGLEALGIERDRMGRIKVDSHYQTNVRGVYAIGDVIEGPMLAHKAEEEGVAIAEILAGQAGHVNYETCPNIIYTWPEVAGIGKTEEELKKAGIAYKVGKFPMMANSRAKAVLDTDGQVKILADAASDRILGAHIVAPDAGGLIHEIAMAMEFGGSAEDVARAFHGHPTFNEAIKEAALAISSKAIHI